MPHATVQLVPGVDTYKTQALLQAAVFTCNLIRYAPDPSGAGLVQKLGGWARYFSGAMPATPRELWGWADLNNQNWLAVGTDIAVGTGVSTLGVINGGNFSDITPHVLQDNVAVNIATTSGSNVVVITDASATLSNLDVVFVPVHISLAGIIVYGFYPITPVSGTTYSIQLFDTQGNPILATTTTSGGTIENFTTTSGSPVVEVELIGHGYTAGDTYPVAVATLVGGITLAGNYTVQSIIDADHFNIMASNAATANDTESINGGNARYDYWLAAQPSPPGLGYGVGGYGVGGYGSGIVPVGSLGTSVATQDWTLDNWGEILIAVPTLTTFDSPTGIVQGGPVCYWDPLGGISNAQAIAAGGAPVACNGAFVAMPQRQIVAWGCDGGEQTTGIQDPLQVRWCDVDNFFSWNATPINLAGSYRLTRGSRIVSGMQAGQQGVLWTDTAVWVMQFVGASGTSTAVYSFNEVARGCGLLAPKGKGILSSVVYWIGQSQFFSMSTSGVQPLECPVWDKIFQNLDKINLRKIRCAPNSNFGEITWHFPSLDGSGENDFYVKFNSLIGAPQGWDFGFGTGPQNAVRTAWVDQSVLGPPIGGDGLSNLIFQHEISNDADGQAMQPFFQTGYFVLNDADILYFIDQFVPDMKWGLDNGTSANAQVQVTFLVKGNFADDPVQTYGPYTLSQALTYITPRFRGALVALQFSSNDVGTWWRIGANRFRYQPDGKFY